MYYVIIWFVVVECTETKSKSTVVDMAVSYLILNNARYLNWVMTFMFLNDHCKVLVCKLTTIIIPERKKKKNTAYYFKDAAQPHL